MLLTDVIFDANLFLQPSLLSGQAGVVVMRSVGVVRDFALEIAALQAVQLFRRKTVILKIADQSLSY